MVMIKAHKCVSIGKIKIFAQEQREREREREGEREGGGT